MFCSLRRDDAVGAKTSTYLNRPRIRYPQLLNGGSQRLSLKKLCEDSAFGLGLRMASRTTSVTLSGQGMSHPVDWMHPAIAGQTMNRVEILPGLSATIR